MCLDFRKHYINKIFPVFEKVDDSSSEKIEESKVVV